MARKKQVNVKSYRRKDGTVVRSSSRSVMTVGDKNVNKRQNTLGGHIRKGATILGAIGGASGALGGAVMGGLTGGLAGPVGAVTYGAGGAFGGGISGAGYGAGTYYLKKKLAKDRSKRNFDYSKINTNTGDVNQTMFIGNVEKTSYEFARRKGAKDKKPRSKRSMLGTGAKIAGGLAGAGAIGYAGIKNRKAIGAGLSKAGGFAKKQAGAAGGFARDVAMVGEMKARQMGRKTMNAGRSAVSKAKSMGSSAMSRGSDAVAGARNSLAGGAEAGRNRLAQLRVKMANKTRQKNK